MGSFFRRLRTVFGRGDLPEHPGPPSLRIRRMVYRDLDAVAAIESQSFSSPWRTSSYGRSVAESHQHFYVAELDGRLVGYAGFWAEAHDAHIAKVAVGPKSRRRGIASALLTHLLGEIRELGLRRAYLEVRRTNLAAQELYRRFGFRLERVRPSAYPNDGEDALIFVLTGLQDDDRPAR